MIDWSEPVLQSPDSKHFSFGTFRVYRFVFFNLVQKISIVFHFFLNKFQSFLVFHWSFALRKVPCRSYDAIFVLLPQSPFLNHRSPVTVSMALGDGGWSHFWRNDWLALGLWFPAGSRASTRRRTRASKTASAFASWRSTWHEPNRPPSSSPTRSASTKSSSGTATRPWRASTAPSVCVAPCLRRPRLPSLACARPPSLTSTTRPGSQRLPWGPYGRVVLARCPGRSGYLRRCLPRLRLLIKYAFGDFSRFLFLLKKIICVL